MKVIFLDIDGVLNDRHTETRAPTGFIGLNADMVKNLKTVVDATGAKIVLVSTWKSEWDHDPNERTNDGQYLVDILETYDMGILDKTTDRVSDRGHGIRNYLAVHPEIKQFVILDDDVFPDYHECDLMPYLVKTSFYSGGLTAELAQTAIDKLS